MRSFCDGEVHPDPSSVQLHAVGSFFCLTVNKHINDLLRPRKQSNNRFNSSLCQLILSYLFSVIFVLKVNESEAPGSPRLLVIHNRDIRQGAIFRKDFPQIPLCGVQAQAKHSQATVWVWISLQTQ